MADFDRWYYLKTNKYSLNYNFCQLLADLGAINLEGNDTLANFPDHQRTGALAEQDVTRLFTSWGWNAGKDQIDSGYDLCVGPDHIKYKGARFMVQVKGTASKKSKKSITAPVDKARLRQYAESVLPVFIVRVTSDGGIYWIHAQAWAKLYEEKLSGAGSTGVNIDRCNNLKDRELFEKYLDTALRSSPTRGKSVNAPEEELAFLNSLDQKLGVRIKNTGRGKEYELFGRQEEFEANFSFQPRQDKENIANLRDAIHFGLPRSIEIENFSVTGSQVFDHLPNGSLEGKISIEPLAPRSGHLTLYSSEQYSVTCATLSTDVKLYTGTQGLAISNEQCKCPFSLVLRFGYPKEGQLNATLHLRDTELAKLPLKEFGYLRPINEWVDQVFLRKEILLEVQANGKSLRMPILRERMGDFQSLLHWWRTVSRLHLVAKSMDSEFVLHEGVQISHDELNDINLAYAILKGEKIQLRALEMTVETDALLEDIQGRDFYCTTTLAIEIQGQPLGDVPVTIELINYQIERLLDDRHIRIFSQVKSEAWLSYDDKLRQETETFLRRKGNTSLLSL